jgi:hypothetical protein
MKRIDSRLIGMLLCAGMVLFSATGSKAASMATQGGATGSSILKISPGMSPAVLAGRPDSESVQLPSGRTITLGKLRELSRLSQRLKEAKAKPLPTALTLQPAKTGRLVKNANDLSAALKRPDSETVQLPSGKRITVGTLRYLQPLVEQRLGRKFSDAGTQPDRAAKIIKIESTTDKKAWINILKQPDATVLESPAGKRITVGELKLALETQLAGNRQPTLPPVPVKR